MGRNTKAMNAQMGERLRQLRLMRGLTQKSLAATMGVSYQQIQKYESGTNVLSLSRMQLCAESLGVTRDYFLNGPEQEGPPLDLSRRQLLYLMQALRQIEKRRPAMFKQLCDFIVGLAETGIG